MSAALSQVILHPTLSNSLKILGTTLGRDKVYRALQYWSKFLAWYLLARGSSIESLRWDSLAKAMGSCRKMLRLGKPIEHLQAAQRSLLQHAPLSEQFSSIGRQLAYAGFITYDGLAWAASIRFLKVDAAKQQQLQKTAFRFWLTGILFSLGHGLFKAGRLANEAKVLTTEKVREKQTIGSEEERNGQLKAVQVQRQIVRAQMVLDVLDVWIPAANLGLVNLSDGVTGLLGLTTSLMSLKAQWIVVTGKK